LEARQPETYNYAFLAGLTMEDATKLKFVPALPPNTRIDRYEILSLLGAGGMGEVYLARDERLGREVAIKFLPVQLVQDEGRVRRFELEARAASALNHPNIVTVHELGECQAGRFIVMELVQGRTLRKLIQEGLPLDVMLELAEQTVKALAVAHKAGIVHRDLKPENIMVRDDRYVKVLDFGLARLASSDPSSINSSSENQTKTGDVIGTARYMSPEQARGEVLGSASDIFSLGLVFYEMATKRHPFDAGSLFATLHRLSTEDPIPPSQVVPEIPQILDDLILSMLDKEERLRPSAEEVQARLSAARGSGPIPGKPLGAPDPDFRRSVDRQKEREQLQTAFLSAVSGRGSVLCVAGEAGLGKTTLAEDFLRDLAESTAQCIMGRGRSSERLAGTEALLCLLEALDSLLHYDRAGGAARTLKLLAPTWYAQLAPLTESDSSTARVLDSKAHSQERMKRELGSFFQELTRRTPVILFFDDFQWADVSTIDMIAYLASKFESLRLLIVVAYRQSELLLAKHPFLGIKPDLQTRGLCREITLGFLGAKDVQDYLALSFPGNRFPQLAASIYARTEGNPLFMADLARYLQDRNVVAREKDGWVLTENIPEIEKDLPESVRAMIQRMIDKLTDEDRRVLTAASVQGHDFDSAVLSKVLEIDPDEVEERLETLERVHRLIQLTAEEELPNGAFSCRYRFVQFLYQNALYDSLRPTRKRMLSDAIAQALLGFYESRSSEIAYQLAPLFEAARDFARASEFYFLASQNAALLFAHREAAILARRGLELLGALPAAPERDRQELPLQLALARSLCLTVGYTAEQPRACFTRAYELAQAIGDQVQFFPAIWGLWMYYVVGADCRKARELSEQLLRIAESAADRSRLVAAHYANALSLELTGDLAASRKHVELLFSFDEPGRHRTYISNFLVDPTISGSGIYVRLLWLLGYPDQSRQKMDELLARINQEKLDPRSICDSLITTCCYYQFCNQAADARSVVDRLIRICEEYEMPQEREWARFLDGWTRSQLESPEAIEDMLSSFRILTGAGAHMFVSTYYASILAQAFANAGDVKEALGSVLQALDFAGQSDNHYFESELHRIRGELLEKTGSTADEAEGCLRKALEVARNQEARSLELRAAISLSRLLRNQGKLEEARALLSSTYGWFTEGFDTHDLKEARALLKELS
jgi:predicted ATPase/predicted Ser/Thr protein kinase